MTREDQAINQALSEGNEHFCLHCQKVQLVELTCYNPDEDDEPDLVVCLVCKEAIGFIDEL